MKNNKHREKKLHFEKLEDRIFFSATPAVDPKVAGLQGTSNEGFINESFEVNVEFQNKGTETGYGPHVDVFVEKGIDASDVEATSAGEKLNISKVTYDDQGNPSQAKHPLTGEELTKDASRAGGTLIIAQVPGEGLEPNQQAGTISFKNLKIENDPNLLNQDLDIKVVGGFYLGKTINNDPGTDPSITGETVTTSITPQVYKIAKILDTKEDETATGPNYEYSYSIDVDIADAQNLDNLTINDYLPDGFILTGLNLSGDNGIESITLNGNPLALPYIGSYGPAADGNNLLSIDFGDETGTASSKDIAITLNGYINSETSAGSDILNANDQYTNSITNNVYGTALYNGGDVLEDAEATLTAKALPIQKTVEILDANTGEVKDIAQADDILKYIINFQVSDYLALNKINIQDLLSDGQTFLNTGLYLPVLTIKEAGAARLSNNVLNNGNIILTSNADGTTLVQFNVSQELVAEGESGTLAGDLYGDASVDGATTGTLIFYAKALDNFTENPISSGTSELSNEVEISGEISDESLGVQSISDTSQTTITYQPAYIGTLSSLALDPQAAEAGPVVQIYLTVDKEVTDSTEAGTGSVTIGDTTYEQLTIGEEVTFTITATFPQGATNQTYITDSLSYIDATFEILSGEITYVGDKIQFLDASGMHPFDPTFTLLDTNADTINDAGQFYFNRVLSVYQPFDPIEDSQIVMQIKALVLNRTENQQDDIVINKAEITYQGQGGGQPGNILVDEVPLQVVEPDLQVDKAVDDSNLPDATYTLTVSHTADSKSNAYGVNVIDDIPDAFQVDSFTAFIGATDVTSQFTIDGSNTLMATGDVDILLGETLVITINGKLSEDAVPGDIAGNFGTITWTSLNDTTSPQGTPGDETGERTGQDDDGAYDDGNGPAHDDVLNNYYRSSNTVTINIPLPTIEKNLVDTSESSTTGTDVVIGEVVTYELTIDIPAGTLPDGIVLTDMLPEGMAYVDGTAQIGLSTFNGTVEDTGGTLYSDGDSINASDLDYNTGTHVLTINLGETTVVTDEIENNNSFTITYQAVVLNVAGNQGDASETQTELTNEAQMVIDDPTEEDNSTITIDAENEPTVTVVEPKLLITKLIDDDTVAPGDNIQYTITIEHDADSLADAFDLTINDPLPSQITSEAISSAILDPGGANTDISSQLEIVGGVLKTINGANIDLAQGDTIEIVITGQIDPLITTDQSFENTISVQWTSINNDDNSIVDPNERTGTESPAINDYVAMSTESTLINTGANVTIQKIIKSTTESSTPFTDTTADLAIGEQATFEITLTFPNGTTEGVVVTDQVTGNAIFEIIGSKVVSIGSNLTTDNLAVNDSGTLSDLLNGDGVNDTVTFDFGNVEKTGDAGVDNSIVIEVTALVRNVAENQQGDEEANTAEITYGASGDMTLSDSVEMDVVEPDLQVTKGVDVTTGDAGDPIAYTLTISHTLDSHNDAFDLSLIDNVPSEIDISSFTAILDPGGTNTDISSEFNLTGNILSISGDVDLPSGDEIEITINGTLAQSVEPGEMIKNDATIAWTSLDDDTSPQGTSGSDTGERTGSGLVNDYTADSNIVTITVPTPTIDKAIIATSEPSTEENTSAAGDVNATIGEVITYELSLNVPEGTIPAGMEITDFIPSGMEYLDGTAKIDLSSFNGSIEDTGSSSYTDGDSINGSDIDFSGGTLTINFGEIVATGDNDAVNNTFKVTYQAVVLNVSDNQGDASETQTTLTNEAAFEIADPNNVEGSISDDTEGPTVTVVEPDLEVNKTAHFTNDSEVTYTITIQHTADSLADAFDLMLNDTIPAEILNPVIDSVTNANIADFDLTGNVLTISNPDNVDLPNNGNPIVIVVKGTLDIQNTNLGDLIENDVTVTWTSINNTSSPQGTSGAQDGERTGEGDVNDYFAAATGSFLAKIPSISKELDGTSEEYTAGTDVAIGEVVTYKLTVNLSNGITKELHIYDLLPTGMEYVDGNTTIILSNFSGTIKDTAGNAYSDGDPINPDDIFVVDNTINILFGDIIGQGQGNFTSFSITYQGLVQNVLSNQRGIDLTNEASLTLDDPDSINPANVIIANTPQDVTVTVVEPTLVITKAVSASNADPGDEITYTIEIKHDASSDSDAFQLTINDPIPSQILEPFLVSAILEPGDGEPPVGITDQFEITLDGTLQTKTGADIDLRNLPDAKITIVMNGIINPNITQNQTITNTVQVQWESLDHHSTYRSGAGSPDPAALNNYFVFGSGSTRITFGTTPRNPLEENAGFVNAFNEGQEEEDSLLLRISPFRLLVPIYSGSAIPGSTLVVEVYDSNGALVSSQTVMTDEGGNWMARFPASSNLDNPDQIRVKQTSNPESPSSYMDAPEYRYNYSPIGQGLTYLVEDITTGGVLENEPAREMVDLYKSSLNPVEGNWDEASYKYFFPEGKTKGD